MRRLNAQAPPPDRHGQTYIPGTMPPEEPVSTETPTDNRHPMRAFRCDATTWEIVEEHADKRDGGLSGFLRKAIQKYGHDLDRKRDYAKTHARPSPKGRKPRARARSAKR